MIKPTEAIVIPRLSKLSALLDLKIRSSVYKSSLTIQYFLLPLNSTQQLISSDAFAIALNTYLTPEEPDIMTLVRGQAQIHVKSQQVKRGKKPSDSFCHPFVKSSYGYRIPISINSEQNTKPPRIKLN